MTDHDAIEVWKATIDVQKHFNELSLRVRSIAVTVLAAFLAAAGYTLREKSVLLFLGQQVSLTGMILLSALICWMAFYVMDRLWYHRLLRAAVAHGRKVEAALKGSVPTIGLTETIDDASPILGLRAGHRLSIFYGFIAALLWLGAGTSLRASWTYYGVGLAVLLVTLLMEFWPRSRDAQEAQAGPGAISVNVGNGVESGKSGSLRDDGKPTFPVGT